MSESIQGSCPNCGRDVNESGYCPRCYAAYRIKYYPPHIAERLKNSNPGLSGLRIAGVIGGGLLGALFAPVVLPALAIYNHVTYKKKKKS